MRSSVCFSALLGLRQLDKYCLLFGALSAELGGGGGVRVEDENRLPAALNHDLDMQADLSFPRETGPLPENSLRVQV